MKLFMGLFTLSLQFSRFISFQNKAVFTNINRLIHNSPLLYARPKKTDKYIIFVLKSKLNKNETFLFGVYARCAAFKECL